MHPHRSAMAHQVCVTGANGFLASWLVQLLLQRGYHVRGMVRSPGDKLKVGHLEALDGAKDRLTLVKGDLLDYDSVAAAIHGCSGVFHAACPVPSHTSTNPEVEVLNPAITGTLNVLKACIEARVKRVIMTSSGAAVSFDPNRPKEAIVDETCWSNEEYLRENKHWYMLGKTLGEKAAWDYSKQTGLDLIVICPTSIIGALLQPTPNASSLVVLKLINGSSDSYENSTYGVVDVKDVARAHILAYETPGASGRYLCCRETVSKSSMVAILKRLHPEIAISSRCIEVPGPPRWPEAISTRRLQDLGLTYTPLETSLKETVESFKANGLLH